MVDSAFTLIWSYALPVCLAYQFVLIWCTIIYCYHNMINTHCHTTPLLLVALQLTE